ncbi:MAG: Peptide chain release factor N(5)-glutamine methyltransferase, partial [Bacteroidota bacterium]
MGSKEVFQILTQTLSGIYGSQEAEAIAFRILDLAFNLGKLDFLLNKEVNLPADWQQYLNQLAAGRPFQYVIGKEFFRDLRIGLNDATLIPRPETEELVQYVLNDLKKVTKPVRVLDIGTGSGCIPLSLKNEFPALELVGWDISEKALQQANENAQHLQLLVTFQLQDIFQWQENSEMWDMIISNPPYVLEAEKSEMLPHVVDHEPHLALFVPNEDPLKYYITIADMAISRLNTGGKLYFEINQAYGNEVKEMLISKGFK